MQQQMNQFGFEGEQKSGFTTPRKTNSSANILGVSQTNNPPQAPKDDFFQIESKPYSKPSSQNISPE